MAITLGTNGYCEISDIEGLTQADYSDSNSKPTEVQVEAMITARFNELNGVLKTVGYSVPIATSATISSAILKEISKKGVAADALRAKRTPGGSGVATVSDLAKSYLDEYEADLQKLAETREGRVRITLPDATSDDVGQSSLTQEITGEFNLDSDGDERDSAFSRDMLF